MENLHSYPDAATAFPFFLPVRRGVNRFTALGLAISIGAAVALMISILFLEVPFWIAIPLVLVAILLLFWVLVKAYICWRIRLYSEAPNIRQTHMLMLESTDALTVVLEFLTKA